MSGDFEIERRCKVDKVPGIAQLFPTHLLWTPDSAGERKEVRVQYTDIASFQVSKQGAAKKAMMRLNCSDGQGKITLDFGKDFSDRDVVRDILNKLQQRGASVLANRQSGPSNGGPPKPPQKPITPKERMWRKRLLQRKEVVKLHRKLVIGGAVNDEKFWNGMRYRYRPNGEKRQSNREIDDDDDEQMTVVKDYGVPSDAFTAENKCLIDVETWNDVIPTPGERHLVFMEYPYMAVAVRELSARMSEEHIWKMFRSSSMVARRGSLSKSQAAITAEADAKFAPFQAREHELLEHEREKLAKGLDRGLNLDRFDDHRSAHVLEGHTAGGEARPRKRARGPTSQSLRLMQTVNRHGELIVREGGESNWTEMQAERGRPLDDLNEERQRQFAKLGMAKRPGAMQAVQNGQNAAMGSVAHAVWNDLQGWNADIERFGETKVGSGTTLSALLDRMQP